MTTTRRQTTDGRNIWVEVEKRRDGSVRRVEMREGMSAHGIGETLEQAEETLLLALQSLREAMAEQ